MPSELLDKCLLIYSDESARHKLSETHPMRPIRLAHMYDLMRASSMLDAPNLTELEPIEATHDDIRSYHDPEYVDLVSALDKGAIVPNMWQYGFGPGDNPPRRGMFRHAALAVGGVLQACDAVADGDATAAFVPAAGMHHHAMRDRASGFGIFNDAVIGILKLIERGYRVLYVDIDVHHGDGVQAGLYDTDRALTLSIHESGQWLFPGTGAPNEIGTGDGTGYSVNVPLAPGSDDAAWHRAFNAVFMPVADAYRPDILFTQLGIDTHRDDPLAHLELTTQGHNLAVQKFAAYSAERGCPWIAVGGGGYDFSAVARGWTMDAATMAGFTLPDTIPASFTAVTGPSTFADPVTAGYPAESMAEITEYNDHAVDEVRRLTFDTIGV